MSSVATTPEDYRFFDFLAPYRWPGKTPAQIMHYRELIEDGDLHIETLLENALAVQSEGLYKRIAKNYMDFTDRSDAKKSVSQHRNNDIKRRRWTNSCAITGLKGKLGVIRAVCYSKARDQFYFFAIPHKAYSGMNRVDILLDCSVGYEKPKGIPKGKWTRYQVDSFKRLATITEEEVDRL